MTWDVARVSELKNLWLAGLSASQIARKLGDGVSRNAVIGKVHRLGLGGRGQPKTTEAKAQPEGVEVETSVVAPAPVPEPQAQSGRENEVAILGLSERKCRWPLGDPRDPDFRFCGAGVTEGEPYCIKHARLAYQQTSPRRASA